MTPITQWIETHLGLSAAMQEKLLATLLTLALLILLRWVLLRVVTRRTEDARTLFQWRKFSGYVAWLVGIFIIGRVWIEGFQSISTFLGLVSAGLTIALQTPIVNLAGWAFILWRRPFDVGDRIQVGSDRGDVIDQRIFMFTMMEIGNWVDAEQATGRVIHVPNGRIFSEPLANYTKGFEYIYHEIAVLVTFESDWRGAKGILDEIVGKHTAHMSEEAERQMREAARRFLIFYKDLKPEVYTTVRDSGVLLTLRFLCNPRQRRLTEQAIWEDILEAFAARDDIDFAYPTQRFYNNVTEGKPEVRAGGSGVE